MVVYAFSRSTWEAETGRVFFYITQILYLILSAWLADTKIEQN